MDKEQELYEYMLSQGASMANMDSKNLEQVMGKIAFHETGGKMDPSITQSGGGPGKGLFQYETSEGDGSGAGRSAMNRVYNLMSSHNMEIPDWVSNHFKMNQYGGIDPSGDVDASSLTEKQQKILFLGDKIKDPKVKLSDLNKDSLSEWWAKNHRKKRGSAEEKQFALHEILYSIQ